MYFVYVYENRIMKSVEIVLRRGEGGMRDKDEGVNLIKVYCKHICKCDTESPCTINIY
jgi:hypothetical protein